MPETTPRRLTRAVLAVVSGLVLVLSVTGWAVSEKYLSGLSTVNVFGGLAGGSAWSGEPINILLVGSDDRSTLTREQRRETSIARTDFGRHTDTMLLVHLGGDLGHVTVVSIPRDSLVDIPAHTGPEGEQIAAHKGKINSAFATGGPAVTVQTVEAATGLTVDHYVEVNFGGFLNVVDSVEGVEVCLDQPLLDERSGLNLPAGRQTIQGSQALAYVRARYIDNDFGRAQRQQKFLSALTQKVFGSGVLLNPVALNSFIDSAVASVTTDERLSIDTIAGLAARGADLDLSHIVFTTVPVSDGDHMYEGESTVLWDAEGAPALFAALAQDAPLPKAPKAVPVEVPPDDITLAVSGDPGKAAQATADLREAGYVTQAGPAGPTPAKTTVRYDPAFPNSAKTLKTALPGAVFQQVPGMGQTFQLIVGQDYQSLVAVRSAATSVEATVRSARDNICS